MDSFHSYFETRVLSVSHTMIDNVPNSSNCVILLLPYHERAIKWKYLDRQCLGWWLVALWHQAITCTSSDLRLLASIPAYFSCVVSSDQSLINTLKPKYHGQHFIQSIVKLKPGILKYIYIYFFYIIIYSKIFLIFVWNSLLILQKSNPIPNSAVTRTMACYKTGNKPLPKPVLAPFIDACILQQV